jgi:hypothetical protein
MSRFQILMLISTFRRALGGADSGQQHLWSGFNFFELRQTVKPLFSLLAPTTQELPQATKRYLRFPTPSLKLDEPIQT